MKAKVSALYDGEIEVHEAKAVLDDLHDDLSLRDDWHLYGLIGDQLRGERAGMPDLTASIMARVREEPAILAPENLPRRDMADRPSTWLALAATVAGVAAVGWMALSLRPGTQAPFASGNEYVRQASVPQPIAAGAAAGQVISSPGRSDISELLLAHHMQASTFALAGGADHARGVSVVSHVTGVTEKR